MFGAMALVPFMVTFVVAAENAETMVLREKVVTVSMLDAIMLRILSTEFAPIFAERSAGIYGVATIAMRAVATAAMENSVALNHIRRVRTLNDQNRRELMHSPRFTRMEIAPASAMAILYSAARTALQLAKSAEFLRKPCLSSKQKNFPRKIQTAEEDRIDESMGELPLGTPLGSSIAAAANRKFFWAWLGFGRSLERCWPPLCSRPRAPCLSTSRR